MRIYPGTTVDYEFATLGGLGYTGTLNDRQFAALRAEGLTGSLPDMFGQFDGELGGGLDLVPANVKSWMDFRVDQLDYVQLKIPNSEFGTLAASSSGLVLDGSSGLAWDWVTSGVPITGDFTLELFDLIVANEDGSIIGNEAGGTGTRSLHIYYRTSLSGLSVITGTDTVPLTTTTVTGVPIGTPFHFCIERTGDTWRVYFNGVPASTWTQAGTLRNPNRSWYLGCRGASGGRDFKQMTVKAVRLTDDALYSGAFTPPACPTYVHPTGLPEDVVYGAELLRGARTWFNSLSMLRDGNLVLFPSVSNTNEGVRLASWNLDTDEVLVRRTATTAQDDDHNEGGIGKLANGNYLFASVAHNSSSFQINTGTSLSSWSEANIAPSLGVSNLSYANIIQLEGEVNDPIYLFGRGGSPWSSRYSVSTDGGATWAAYTIWCENGGHRPYVQYWKTSDTRIDFVLTQGHPEALATSIYHGYLEGGVFYKTDGTALGPLPIAPSDFTLVYDGTVTRGWVWDLKRIGGVLVMAFATFPSTTAHRYHRAILSGSTWSHEVVETNAGGYLYVGEPYYSGGICLHPTDKDIVFASKATTGAHQLYRYNSDGAGNWSGTQLTDGPRPSFRPDTCDGAMTYLRGVYTSYTAYSPVKIMGAAL